jgi:hypothetical protein
MAPHTPQRSSRPGEPVALLDRAPAGLNHTTSSVREVASPKRPIEYGGSPA